MSQTATNSTTTTPRLGKLQERANLIWTLSECRGLIGWDQQTLMPPGAAAGRSSHLAAMNKITHELMTQPAYGELLKGAEEEVAGLPEDSEERCYVRFVRRAYDSATKLPARLVEDYSRATSAAFEAWVGARKDSDFKSFQPSLEKVFELTREKAECLGYPNHPYDAMLDEWEPGILTREVDDVFSSLQPPLTRLVEELSKSDKPLSDRPLRQGFPVDVQRKFSHYLLEAIGFDFNRGRLDDSAHPFCSSSQSGDVRLTDRFGVDQVTMAIFGSLHEGGHGLYEQGSPPKYDGTPLRGGCSLGVHESQSRLWENFVGRSLPFWKAHFPKLSEAFPQQLSGYSADDFYRAVNVVRPSLIRVEADEVTYTLHIILRFELEKALLTGDLKVADLPGAWNEKMQKYLGIQPPDDAHGCLQDIHWSDGLIGYFPTYSLGNLIAAMLWESAVADMPDLTTRIERGDNASLLTWLRDKIHRHASLYTPKELLQRSLGKALDSRPFMAYLEGKFKPLYGLR